MRTDPKSSKLKILLIDDNPEIVLLIRNTLTKEKRYSFDVECVDRLQTGLESLAKGKIDLVLLDLGLPDSCGLETFLKTQRKAPYVPIVVLTGLEDEELGLKALQSGAQDYLIKGQFTVKLLVTTIRYAIERHRLRVMLDRQILNLQTLEDDLHNVITRNADSMVIVDKNGAICFANPAAKVLFGRTMEELVGQIFGFPVVKGETTEVDILRGGGETTVAEMRVVEIKWQGEIAYLASLHDITERKWLEEEWETLNLKFQDVLDEVKALQRLLPVCGACKKRRKDKEFWRQLESYLRDHSEADCTYGVCPDCYEKEMRTAEKIKKRFKEL
jgi:DNA-binding response OmpR family regulator